MLINSTNKEIKLFLVLLFCLSFLISCSNTAQESQKQTQILMDYALYYFPLPSDSEIQMDDTLILDSVVMWASNFNV